MDLDPEEDKEGEGGVGGNEGIGDADDADEKMPCGPSSPFPRRRRRRSPGLLLSYISLGDESREVAVQTTKYKHDNNK